MKCFKTFSWYLVLILLYISVLLPLAVRAQESTGLRIQPAIIEERIDPGFTYSSVLRVTNLSEDTKTFYIIKRNIGRLSPTGAPVFAQAGEETGFEIISWIDIPMDPITISAGQTEEVPFSIEVPQNASPGGHFGGIFITLTPERPQETGVGVGYQVGTIINLRISGEVFEEARMREFRTDKAIYSKPDVTFITRVENIGNVLIRPRGPLEITDFFGKKVATLRMNNEGAAVLPKQIRQFEISWEGEGLVFGRYQVLLGLVYGQDERKNISATLSFWVLPLNIILPVVGGILGFILAIFILVKFYIRKKLRQLKRSTETISYGSHASPEAQAFLHHKKGGPFPYIVVLAIAMLIFILIFLVVLFFFFA